jgi:hypothetical protein
MRVNKVHEAISLHAVDCLRPAAIYLSVGVWAATAGGSGCVLECARCCGGSVGCLARAVGAWGGGWDVGRRGRLVIDLALVLLPTNQPRDQRRRDLLFTAAA